MKVGINSKTQRIMKKSYALLAALAALSVISCQKEKENTLDSRDDAKLTKITATVNDADTKAYVDGLQVKWSAGDVIAVANSEDDVCDFTLSEGANTASGTFSGNLGGKTLGDYALYPKTSNVAFLATDASVDYLADWSYGKSEVPMYGVNDGAGSYTFHNIGGALQVTYKNLPATSVGYFFKLTETHTGSEAKYITGTGDISDLDSTPSFAITSNQGQEVTVNDIPKDATDVTLIIPVPAGTGYNFKVELYEVGEATPIEESVKNATGRDITAGKILRFPDIVIPPVANGTILWSENFGTFGSSGTAFGSITGADISDYATDGYTGRSGLGDNARVTLSSSNSNVKVSTVPTANMTDGHLWFVKDAEAIVTTSSIKLYGATAFTLEYDQATSGSATVAQYSDDSGDNWKDLGTQSGPGSAQFSQSGLSVSSILIRVKHESTNTKNTRVDNLVVTAGAPEPGVRVTTNAATSVSTTGATLNGTIELINEGVQSSISEAGFVYKVKGDSAYGDPVTVADPTASLTFSKAITGLTEGTTYTFKAYAKYNGGSAVYGDEVDVKAEVPATVATAEFGNATGKVALNSSSTNFEDSESNAWTCTVVGTTSFTANSAYYQIGSSNKPATSITFTHTLTSAKTIKSFEMKFGGFNGTAGTVSIKVGDDEIASGSLNGTSDVSVKTAANFEGKAAAEDAVISVTVTGISKGVKVYDMTWSY